jgi:predicted  nucleic acid-binding Zn-ribbon protein
MSEVDAVRALMDADRWIDRVRSQRTHLPEKEELNNVERELRAALRAIQETQAALDPAKLAYEDAEREAERLRKREGELARALGASTANARELEAMQKEVVHVRALLAESEDRELESLLALEPLEEALATLRANAQPQVARRSTLQEEISSLEASLDDELVSLVADREARATALSPELRARYDAALARAGTSGAAQVDAGKCDGCRIALSPLDLDRWKAEPPGSFMACPECGRLLLP